MKREIQLLMDKVEKKQTKEGTELYERNMNMPPGSLQTNATFDPSKAMDAAMGERNEDKGRLREMGQARRDKKGRGEL